MEAKHHIPQHVELTNFGMKHDKVCRVTEISLQNAIMQIIE